MNELRKNQKNFFDIISKIINLNKLSHSYLIEINNYEKDFDYIKEFVKIILCNTDNLDFNKLDENQKKICNLVDNNNYPDIQIIDPEGQWIKKNQLLNLKEEYQNKSLLNNKRIYIIKNTEKLNSSSANTILKFLEEPEENIIALLITNNRYQVLDTILSRCQVLSLINNTDNCEIDEEDIDLLKFIINGNDLFINYKYIVDKILIDKESTSSRILKIENILINYLDNRILNNDEFNKEICNILDDVEVRKITKIISIIEKQISNLVYNVNYKIWLDAVFSKIVEV